MKVLDQKDNAKSIVLGGDHNFTKKNTKKTLLQHA